MHYYKRNIGDYHKKAGRLTLLQHGVYTVLMDAIYDREKFPTKQEALDWTWAATPEEVAAVELILSKFFTNGNGIYKQKRIEEELNAFRSRSETNQRIAIERETKRAKKNTKRARLDHESPPNHKPLTINQEPLPKEINPISWQEFEQHRKDIRKPLSDLARTKAINLLSELSFEDQTRTIDKTIQNRWTGLFPDKPNEKNQRTNRPESNHSAVVRRLADRMRNE